ncbi:hypothetical protein SAMN05660971_03735 [Halomonas cupida]|uniref:Uncharacterized protein n=1 Tax=Halomonas cupida TaxID=44933 RepID=A0A1M7L894_9GAMM|nr:hypothetical protein SAMN05660971_03735 [Halomonas cupida]
MSGLCIVILLVASLVLFVCVINPRWALPWSSTPKRFNAKDLFCRLRTDDGRRNERADRRGGLAAVTTTGGLKARTADGIQQ